MMTDALKALFALLETDEDDFAVLVQRFNIDPATDLQNCDLTNVDFGKLTAETLNLTGSTLDGTKLSRVRCKQIIGADGLITQPARRSLKQADPAKAVSRPILDAAVFAVSKYQNTEWTVSRLLESHNDSRGPIAAFFETFSEQDVLTKRLCSVFAVHDAKHKLNERPNFMWFYTKDDNSRFELSAASLERNFFDLLRSNKTSDDIGVYPYLSNRQAVSRIRDSLENSSYDRMRGMFARQLELEIQSSQLDKEGCVVLFSGFPPISKRLYHDIRSASNQRLKLIFLCSSNLERFYEKQPEEWRRLVVPAIALGQPEAIFNDIGRICRRIEAASSGTVTLGEGFQNELGSFIGKPLALLKNEIVHRLTTVANNLPMNGLIFTDLVL